MRQTWLWLLGLLLVSVLALSVATPVAQQVPGPDSAVYLYFGRQVNAGALPYRDLFELKPPGIFYIDALGLLLDGGTRWGVWAFQVIFVFAAALIAFFFLRRYFKTWISGLASVSFLINLPMILDRGNLTEEYALPLQFAALLLFTQLENQKGFRWKSLLFGVLFGLAFMLKQLLIGMWVTLGILFLIQVIWSRKWSRLIEIAWWVAGVALVVLPLLIYFASNNILADFWEGAFAYNFLYRENGDANRYFVLDGALDFITRLSGFYIIAMLTWIASVILLLIEHAPTRRAFTSRWFGFFLLILSTLFLYKGSAQFGRPLEFTNNQLPILLRQLIYGLIFLCLAILSLTGILQRKFGPWLERFQTGNIPAFLPFFVVAVDVPVEIALIVLGANNYPHYFMSFLPVMTVLIAIFIWTMTTWANLAEKRYMPYVWVALFMIPILQNGLSLIQKQSLPGTDSQSIETTQYIEANTQMDDKVLMWGFNMEPNFLSGRASASRYSHLFILFNAGYGTQDRFDAFLREIQSSKPKLIIDTNALPFIYTENGKCTYDKKKLITGSEKVFIYLCQNYKKVTVIGKDQWSIYQKITP